MADEAVVESKIRRTEAEKKKQAEALANLMQAYPLPKNISDMKSYAWGKFTWRDVIVSSACIIVPVMFMLAFQAVLPLFACVLIGIVIGIPLVFVANKHIFTGDLPIEEKVKIYVKNSGQSNLLSWDKTKQNGQYIPSSTQSFVPDVTFDDSYAMLRGNKGGFAIVQLDIEDSTMSKYTEQFQILTQFVSMLNQCIDNQKSIPIQIYMQSSLIRLQGWIDNAMDDVMDIGASGKPTMWARGVDYLSLLKYYDNETRYMYRYYIVITYREDAEGVGDATMNTTSVRREQLKEKANPFRKKMEVAQSADFQIGDDRKAKSKEFMQASEFGKARTRAELDNRVPKITNAINQIGSTNTSVTARLLGKAEAGQLFYEFFNETDKYASIPVLMQALDDKDALWSDSVYHDFPQLFHRPDETHDIYDEIVGNDALKRSRQRMLGKRQVK